MTKYVQTQGGRVAYECFGTEGTAIVGVPGIGDTRACWRVLGPQLAAAGYRFYAMDLRGHGESDTSFGSYSPEGIGDDIVALLEAEDLRDVVLMGNSIGGAAIIHAALRSDRVARLVHINPFVRDMPVERWFRPMVPLMFGGFWGTWMWGKYRSTLFKTLPADQEANRAAVADNLAEPGRMKAVRGMLRATKAGVAARIDQLKVPSLVLMGSNDPDYDDPAAEGRILTELLPGDVELAMIDGTGHYPQIERPEQTLRLVRAYLDPHRSQGDDARSGA